MRLNSNMNYGVKWLHGLQFGLSDLGESHKIATPEYGGTTQHCRVYKHKGEWNTDWSESMIMFGNCWHKEQQWIHPDTIPATTQWHYWDNPELPHLLYQDEHNPLGYKNWCRFVTNHTHTQANTGGGIERINNQLQQLNKSTRNWTWEKLLQGRHDVVISPVKKTVLLCPPSISVFEHYYGISVREWKINWIQLLESRGYRVRIRHKPGRSQREENRNRLYQQLDKVAFTVSIHSASAVESILAGVPAVVDGRSCAGPLGTPAQEYKETNQLRLPTVEEQNLWVDQILANTFHKQELYDGSWWKTKGEQHAI